MYTGKPTIQVPLWTLSAQDIKQTVQLVYNANGVLADQGSGEFGLGWNLSAGGSITRKLRSLPDDYSAFAMNSRRGWLYANAAGSTVGSEIGSSFTNSADLLTSTCTDEQTDFTKLGAYSTEKIDTEPDIFTFSFGGYTGSFVFDNSASPVIRFIPYQDLRITYTTTSATDKSITSFTIKTNDGFTYTFGQVIKADRQATEGTYGISALWKDYDLYSTKISYTSEWKLTRIDSPSGAYIKFNYVVNGADEIFSDATRLGIYKADLSDLNTPVIAYTTVTHVDNYWLSSIEASSGQSVQLTSAGGMLTSVAVKDSRRGAGKEFVKQYAFEYQNGAVGSNVQERVFLKRITELSGCDVLPPYEFDYIGMQEKVARDYRKDFWGYYNNAEAANGVPKLYVYPSEPLAERFRLYPIPNYTGTEIILDGANRVPDETYMKIGVLNRISYPSGGSTLLQYEGNTYFDSRAGTSYPCGGLRIKSITQFDGMNNPGKITKTFSYNDPATNQSSGRLISRPIFVVPVWKYKDPTAPDDVSKEKDYQALVAAGTSLANLYKYFTVRTEKDLSDQQSTNGSPVGYQYITVSRQGEGSSRFEFLMPSTYGTAASAFWTPAQNKLARPNTCPVPPLLADGGGAWGFYPYAPNPDIDFERGLVVNRTDLSEAGVTVQYTHNDYQYLYSIGTQPVTVTGLKYDRYPNQENALWFYSKYAMPTDYTRVLSKGTVTTYDPANTSRALTETFEYFYESPYRTV
jgi:hypothetical protein